MGHAQRVEKLSWKQRNEVPRLKVSPELLLAFYAIVPALLLTVAVDWAFLSGTIKKALPFAPEEVAWMLLFLNVPHIISSSLIFLDREYIKRYRKALTRGFVLITLGVFLLPHLIGEPAFYTIALVLNVKHIIGQQFSISRKMLARAPKYFQAWCWLGILIGALVMLQIFFFVVPQLLPDVKIEDSWVTALHATIIACLVGNAALTHHVAKHVWGRTGFLFVWSNFALMALTYFFSCMNYPFFAILAPRIVHDFTAFAFYTVHNHNRNQVYPHNYLFRALRPLKIPSVMLTPLLGIAFAYPISRYFFGPDQLYQVYFVVSTFHFFTEHFSWRRGSLLQKSL